MIECEHQINAKENGINSRFNGSHWQNTMIEYNNSAMQWNIILNAIVSNSNCQEKVFKTLN